MSAKLLYQNQIDFPCDASFYVFSVPSAGSVRQARHDIDPYHGVRVVRFAIMRLSCGPNYPLFPPYAPQNLKSIENEIERFRRMKRVDVATIRIRFYN